MDELRMLNFPGSKVALRMFFDIWSTCRVAVRGPSGQVILGRSLSTRVSSAGPNVESKSTQEGGPVELLMLGRSLMH